MKNKLMKKKALYYALKTSVPSNEIDASGADLSGAILNGADLSGATLNGADLSCATLNGATLNGADLSCATLNGAILDGADLSGAKAADTTNEKVQTEI